MSITNSPPEIPAAGGNGSLALNTERECAWSASSKDSWITLSATSGQGDAMLGYTVQPNPNGTRRQGHVAVSDQTVEVSQAAAPCQYGVSPTTVDAPSGQVELSVALTATHGCSWNARSNVDWIGSPIPNSGVGSTTVRVVIATNTSQARIGTVTLADATLRVNQAAVEAPAPTPVPTPTPAPTPPPPAPTPVPTPPPNPTPAPCSYGVSLSTISIDAAGGQRSITVTSAEGCAWSATSAVNWIDVASGSVGTGNGSVTVNIGRNSGSARTTTITVASQMVTVQQAAAAPAPCTYAIKPTAYDARRGPETITINVTAGAGCAWSTQTNAGWVTVDTGSTGLGDGIVRLLVQANGGNERSTTVSIAGQPFALHQEGCSYSLKPNHFNAGRRSDDVSIDVNTDAGCAWTASSSVNWVTVTEGAAGTGKGKVRLLIQANDGADRSVVLTIAGQPFDLKQDGR